MLSAAIGRGSGVDDVDVDVVRRLVVRVGDDGVHEFVARGGDAVEVEVDGDVVVWLERALTVGAQRFCDGDEGVVADVAAAGGLEAVVVVKMGPIHVHVFVVVAM